MVQRQTERRTVDKDIPVRSISGNASLDIKESLLHRLMELKDGQFGERSVQHLELVHVSIEPNVREPVKREAKVILETTVNQDMLNSRANVHGACIAHLVDTCTTLPIMTMSLAGGGVGSSGVSQGINVIYHAPAGLGDRLRLIATSTAMGSRTRSAGIEIWDVTHHRLVASATHVKMEPSSKL